MFEPRILGLILVSNFGALYFPIKKRPPKKAHSRDSLPKIHIKTFTPELGLKIYIALLHGHFAAKVDDWATIQKRMSDNFKKTCGTTE